MSSIFAPFYESFFYDSNYQLIFNQLYDGPGYFVLGIILVILPAIALMPFYWDNKLWYRNPYWGVFTWVIWMIAAALIVSILTYISAYQFIFNSNNGALNTALDDPNLNYYDYANWLVWMYTILNGVGALITGFIHSLWLKHTSKLHIHIPF